MPKKLLEKTLDYTFRCPDLLEEALTHASVKKKHRDNERLEFLGDRVLDLVIAKALYDRFPKAKEGDLAARQAYLVSRDVLGQVGEKLNLGEWLRVSREVNVNVAKNKSLLADACEALIGALFLDGGLDVASAFVLRFWSEMVEACEVFERDAKSVLQEWAQRLKKPVPTYMILQQTGPDHDPVFEIGVQIQGLDMSVGKGFSRREAEQNAAKTVLIYLRDHPQNV